MAVEMNFDGVRHLKLDLSAIKDLETMMGGQPLGAVVQQLSQMSITAITAVLWAGLKAEDRTLTPNLVTKMLQTYIDGGGKITTLLAGINDAIQESGLFGNEDADAGNAQPEQTTVLIHSGAG